MVIEYVVKTILSVIFAWLGRIKLLSVLFECRVISGSGGMIPKYETEHR